MKVVLLLSAILLGSPPPAETMKISAQLAADELQIGPEYEIVLRVSTQQGWSASKSGVPAPVLQLDVPASVQLVGKVLTAHKELRKNEFLQAPFERLLKNPEERIKFKLVSKPEADERIALNVLAYVSEDPATNVYLIRRRLVLPLTPHAVATESDASKSDWGPDQELLQIGQPAADFNLPKAYDPPLSLGQYLGAKKVVVTTYRAFW